MSYNSVAMLTDVNGNFIPQYYNPSTNAYEAIEGSYNGNLTNKNAIYVSGNTGTIPTNNTNTVFTIDLVDLALSGGLFNAQSFTIGLVNYSTSQTITGLTLVSYDTINSQEVDINYTPTSSPSIANGGSYTWTGSFNSGLLRKLKLNITFGTAPVNGEVYVQLTVQ